MTYKNFAITLAKKAGAVIRRDFVLGMKKEWKQDGSPVTKTDIAINKLVITAVKKYFPTHGVLGEEESYNSTGTEYLWVCDPVDGTLPFSHGIPIFTFSLALVKNGEPVLGVIFDPMAERFFYAEKYKGAFLNGKKIAVNGLPESIIIHWDEKSLSFAKQKLKKSSFLNLYSICYAGVLVACGQFSAAFFEGKGAHDIAAIKIIVEEAGGRVTDRNGKEQRYDRPINGALITNSSVHKKLLKIIKEIK